MPYLKVNTNLAMADEQAKPMLRRLSALVAGETGKPERYVMVELAAGKPLLFAGTDAPLAYLECKSIGLSPKQAKSLSSSLCQTLNQDLGIAPDRVYIEFSNCPAEFWGWNGSTFG